MTGSSLKEKITSDMKEAMRAKEKERLATIRLILAAMKQKEVDERVDLTDADVTAILDKMCKQRRESIAQYESAGRLELAEKERQEMFLIQAYLPAQLEESELDALIAEVVLSLGATTLKDMGKVMGQLKPKVQGRTDMSLLSAKLKEKLS